MTFSDLRPIRHPVAHRTMTIRDITALLTPAAADAERAPAAPAAALPAPPEPPHVDLSRLWGKLEGSTTSPRP